nr:MAG TPA: CHD-like protein [Caudoviricetes sp.]
MKEDIKVVKDAVSSMSSLVNEMQEDRKLERQNKLEEQIEKRKIRRENKMFAISTLVTIIIGIITILLT